MSCEFVQLCEHPEQGYAELILNRPAARNALCVVLIDAMTAALHQLAGQDWARVVLLRGSGSHFCAGADLAEMSVLDVDQARAADVRGSCVALSEFPKPVVALVQGYALGGGCELVEMADVVIAAENAMFGHPEVKVGLMSGAGGTQRLPRLIGMHKALDLLLTGRLMDAMEAERCGLVSRVVPLECLELEGHSAATALASQAPEVLSLIKRTTRLVDSVSLSDGLKHEREAFFACLALPERKRAIRAFLDRQHAKQLGVR